MNGNGIGGGGVREENGAVRVQQQSGWRPVHEVRGALEQVVEVHGAGRTFSTRMGKVRRSGYVLEWFIGDHKPRHVHVYDAKGRHIGRLDIDRLVGVEGWMPDRSWLSSSKI